MLPLCLQACSERVKEVGGVCVCVGIYVCDSDCSQLFATWIGFIFSGWTYLDSNHCDTRLLMPVVVTESACVLQSSHSVTLPFVRISGDVLDPFSFVPHLSLARSSAPSSSILSVCNNPPLSLFLSVCANNSGCPPKLSKANFIIVFHGQKTFRLETQRHWDMHWLQRAASHIWCSVTTFFPEVTEIMHTYTCVRTKQHILPAPLFSNQAYFLSSLLPIN